MTKKYTILADEKLREILDRGTQEPIIVRCETYNDAVSLRSALLRYIKAITEMYLEVYPVADTKRNPYVELTITHIGKTVGIKKGESLEITPVPSIIAVSDTK